MKSEIGNRLKEFRKTNKLSLSNLATICYSSASYLSDIERGVSNISINILALLFQNFNLNINWLLTGFGNMIIEKQKNHNSLSCPHCGKKFNITISG